MLHRIHPTDPFRTMELFFDAMRTPTLRREAASRVVRKPGVAQIREEDERFVLSAELPGIAPERLELAAGDDWIELRATREVALPEGFKPVRRERANYQFSRRFTLPKRIASDAVEATLREGVLTVTLPKHAGANPRTIEVKAA
ncbi:Hsp20/alpha crystallin family protein [Nannocystaceae bacterium ST9]